MMKIFLHIVKNIHKWDHYQREVALLLLCYNY